MNTDARIPPAARGRWFKSSTDCRRLHLGPARDLDVWGHVIFLLALVTRSTGSASTISKSRRSKSNCEWSGKYRLFVIANYLLETIHAAPQPQHATVNNRLHKMVIIVIVVLSVICSSVHCYVLSAEEHNT